LVVSLQTAHLSFRAKVEVSTMWVSVSNLKL